MRHETPGGRPAAWDDPVPPRVPEPLFPVLRRMTSVDVQKARAWLLAWLLDRLGQRVQAPPPPAFRVERWENGSWHTAAGPFYRQWVAVQIAREFARLNSRWRYRVVGPGLALEITGQAGVQQEGTVPSE
jgi:hypothetical protein